jgi:hypothetical protein
MIMGSWGCLSSAEAGMPIAAMSIYWPADEGLPTAPRSCRCPHHIIGRTNEFSKMAAETATEYGKVVTWFVVDTWQTHMYTYGTAVY